VQRYYTQSGIIIRKSI